MAAGIAGAILAGSTAGLAIRRRDAVITAAAVGAANGALGGWRQIYRWDHRRGRIAFITDSTWALVTTTAALFAHLVALVRGRPGYLAEVSRRCDRHVYARGFRLRRGFLVTVGNVVSGAGDISVQRRRRLVEVHEETHIWQARVLGPLFPLLYAGWMAAGAVAAAVLWPTRHRDRRFGEVVEAYAYYLNPFERDAYRRDGNWPPTEFVRRVLDDDGRISRANR